MDAMENTLKDKVRASGVDIEQQQDMEDKIKTCCDSVQEKIQRRLDRNLDIFDRFVKKNISVARGALDSADTPSSAMDSGTGGSGSGSAGVTVAKRGRATDGVEDWSGFEIDKTATPKRLEDEKEVDADLERIRERRRKAVRRREALERKGLRVAAVLQDVNEFVEAIQLGVSSSFDDNGLTPVPAKVQEAVESSSELREIVARAQGLTRRLEDMQASSGSGRGDEGGSSRNGSRNGVAARPGASAAASRQGDLQSTFERSLEQHVSTGGAEKYAVLRGTLNDR
ncbi:unnamed protein product [Sphacelaria rigidula]